jgi:type IV pilus assembly protein PilB
MSPVESTSRQRPKQEQPAGPETTANGQRQVPRPFMTSFLEHLVRNKIITEEVAHEAAEWKRKNEKDRRSITDLLKEKFGLSPDVLSYQMAQFYAFRVIDVNERGSRRLLPAEIIKLIRGLPETMRQLMMRHKVLPWDVAENQPDKLLVVTPNPAEREIADVARAFAYKKFEICYMKERDWAEYWRQLTAERQTGATVGDVPSEEEQIDLEAILDRDISRGQLQSLLENLFADAVRVGATDVHIVPRAARKTEIYFRIDGQLSLWYSIEDARTESVVALLKTRCPGLDRYERLAAQEGSLQKTIDNQIVRYQASILPVLSRDVNSKFESVAIKILRDASTVGGLDGLHLDQYSAQAFSDVLERRKGLVIVTGPTGNGRTSTLVAALQSVMKPTLSVVSVEDPVKYMVDGVRQVKLGYKLSFDDALQAILRHDPDVVLLGEIRNRAAADVAIRLANTGHLVLCSMQARDTISAILRLYTMNIEPFLIGQGLAMVVAQRLVRKLCERCKEPVAHANDHLLARLGFTQEEAEVAQFYRAVGCINCVGGYKGRLPIFETLPNSPEVEGAILSSWDGLHVETLRDVALRQGMRPLRDTGLDLLKRGITSIEEVASATA